MILACEPSAIVIVVIEAILDVGFGVRFDVGSGNDVIFSFRNQRLLQNPEYVEGIHRCISCFTMEKRVPATTQFVAQRKEVI